MFCKGPGIFILPIIFFVSSYSFFKLRSLSSVFSITPIGRYKAIFDLFRFFVGSFCFENNLPIVFLILVENFKSKHVNDFFRKFISMRYGPIENWGI